MISTQPDQLAAISTVRTNSKVEAALHYAELGITVLPIANLDRRLGACVCPNLWCCKKPGAHPFRDGVHPSEATTTLPLIRHWWERWPNANVAAPVGGGVGHFVLDVDTRDYRSALRLLRQRFGLKKPLGIVQSSGSGLKTGAHLHYASPVGDQLGSLLEENGDEGILYKDADLSFEVPTGHLTGVLEGRRGIDLLGDYPLEAPPKDSHTRGWTILPPSRRCGQYEWLDLADVWGTE